MNQLRTVPLSMLCAACFTAQTGASNAIETPPSDRAGSANPPVSQPLVRAPDGFEFIDTSFENGSPLWYDFSPDAVINVHLLYDNERDSVNRAAGHFHFLITARPGANLVLEFTNLDNIWNRHPASISGELRTAVVSTDGRLWKSVPLQHPAAGRVQLKIHMPGPKLYVARVEPYRLSDLDRFMASIRHNSLVKIETIGTTVEGRELEIVRIGNPSAPHRVFLRARAHPWEAGTSWVMQGFIQRLLDDDEQVRLCRERFCAYVLPMANKDGVTHGRTRFNMKGKDLNREWDKPADPETAPENRALEGWLEAMVRAGLAPELALELHNDGSGLLQLSRPEGPMSAPYLERMASLEKLLRKDTWFTEGSTRETFKNPGSLGEGWLERFGVYAAVHEFNCNWIEGVKDYPSARHWKDYGSALVTVFSEYFGPQKP